MEVGCTPSEFYELLRSLRGYYVCEQRKSHFDTHVVRFTAGSNSIWSLYLENTFYYQEGDSRNRIVTDVSFHNKQIEVQAGSALFRFSVRRLVADSEIDIAQLTKPTGENYYLR